VEAERALENNTKDRMGDIRGKPTAEELQKIEENTRFVAKLLLQRIGNARVLFPSKFPFIVDNKLGYA